MSDRVALCSHPFRLWVRRWQGNDSSSSRESNTKSNTRDVFKIPSQESKDAWRWQRLPRVEGLARRQEDILSRDGDSSLCRL